jgi:hypothetical protein
MILGAFRCPECRTIGHVHDDGERFSAPVGRALPPRACRTCHAKLWVRAGGWPLRIARATRIDAEWNEAKKFARDYALRRGYEREAAPYPTDLQRLRYVPSHARG